MVFTIKIMLSVICMGVRGSVCGGKWVGGCMGASMGGWVCVCVGGWLTYMHSIACVVYADSVMLPCDVLYIMNAHVF